MRHYKHLSINERENLLILSNLGKNISEIAKTLGRNESTISREIKRNSIDNNYSAVNADMFYHNRRLKSKRHKLLDNCNLKSKILKLIVDLQWSPEEISNRLKLKDSNFHA